MTQSLPLNRTDKCALLELRARLKPGLPLSIDSNACLCLCVCSCTWLCGRGLVGELERQTGSPQALGCCIGSPSLASVRYGLFRGEIKKEKRGGGKKETGKKLLAGITFVTPVTTDVLSRLELELREAGLKQRRWRGALCRNSRHRTESRRAPGNMNSSLHVSLPGSWAGSSSSLQEKSEHSFFLFYYYRMEDEAVLDRGASFLKHVCDEEEVEGKRPWTAGEKGHGHSRCVRAQLGSRGEGHLCCAG